MLIKLSLNVIDNKSFKIDIQLSLEWHFLMKINLYDTKMK